MKSFLQKLGIPTPVLMAPMAGEAASAALVAAVSEAGGLGQLGAAYLSPERIRAVVADIRARTDRPFGINLFVPQAWRVDSDRVEAYRQRLAPHAAALGLQLPELPAQCEEDFEAQLAVVRELRPAVVSFVMGDPGPALVQALRDEGLVVIGTATQLSEALQLQESGVHAVVAQGYEAGGHRGGFHGRPEGALIGTLALVPQLVDALYLPVIAAGGIADARGMAAARALGATAAAVGTAFLLAEECPLSPAYREALLQARDADSTLTRAFSGREARGLANAFTREMADAPLPDFPIPNALTRPLRQAAAARGRADFLSLWAGQALPLARPKPAAQLVRELAAGWA
ncbi:MAG TPA: nitronate monooxygenase [Burkholderiaceae bacterium]|nr:nitronate monooxygenase [Burkholderiaceae bacterium]